MKAHHCNFLIRLKVLAIFQELMIYLIPMILMILNILMGMVLRNRDLRKRMGEIVDGI